MKNSFNKNSLHEYNWQRPIFSSTIRKSIYKHFILWVYRILLVRVLGLHIDGRFVRSDIYDQIYHVATFYVPRALIMRNFILNFIFMKYLLTAMFIIATISTANACSTVSAQSFPSVPLSQFGINSWTVAKTSAVVPYSYNLSRCVNGVQARIGASVPDQKFPKVLLSEFNYNSWIVAK